LDGFWAGSRLANAARTKHRGVDNARIETVTNRREGKHDLPSEPKGGEARRSFRGRMTRLSRRLAGHRPPSPFPFRFSRWKRLRAPIRLQFAPHAIIPASGVCAFAKVASTWCKLPTPARRPFRAAPPHPARLRRAWRFAPSQRGPGWGPGLMRAFPCSARLACRPRDFAASLSRICRLRPFGPKPGRPQCAPAECGAPLKSLAKARDPPTAGPGASDHDWPGSHHRPPRSTLGSLPALGPPASGGFAALRVTRM
jgi:hypothetical protein